jgi:excisionase family DNA binding protein
MTKQNSKETKLISLREAARILGVNPQTLRRWDDANKLKAVRVGSRNDRKYKAEDIIKMLEQK